MDIYRLGNWYPIDIYSKFLLQVCDEVPLKYDENKGDFVAYNKKHTQELEKLRK